MKTLKIGKGQHETLIDAELYPILSKKHWSYQHGYSRRKRTSLDLDVPGNSHWIHLHREVLRLKGVGIPEGLMVDHINRNKLDNRFINLRIVTRSENSLNVDESVTIKRRTQAANLTRLAALTPKTEKQRELSRCKITKIIASRKNRHYGINNYKSVGVVDLNSGIIFDNIKIASITLNVNYSTLRSKLNGSNPNNTTLTTFSWK